jgi:2-(1,2-epoxy-1,2-dihydrophenyl)acetyl-CoA isomerase
MTYQTLLFGIENGVARITINRPAQLNAIDVQTAKELALAAKQCRADSAVRCVVLTGAGDRAFCAGGDVAGFASDPERVDSLLEEMTAHVEEAISVFVRMRAPVVAGVNGTVAGAGLGLMAAADLAVASRKAKFTSAYTKIGLTPDGSTTWFLPRSDAILEQQMKDESASIVQMSRSRDGLAGVKAFKDKVEPSFVGS